MLPRYAQIDFTTSGQLTNDTGGTWYQAANTILDGDSAGETFVHNLDSAMSYDSTGNTNALTLPEGKWLVTVNFVASNDDAVELAPLNWAVTDDVSSGSTQLFFQSGQETMQAQDDLAEDHWRDTKQFVVDLSTPTALVLRARCANASGDAHLRGGVQLCALKLSNKNEG